MVVKSDNGFKVINEPDPALTLDKAERIRLISRLRIQKGKQQPNTGVEGRQ